MRRERRITMIYSAVFLLALSIVASSSVVSHEAQETPGCLQFDPTMYAATIDEALYNFPNLVATEKKPMFSEPSIRSGSAKKHERSLVESSSTVGADDCSDVVCQTCKLHVINGFLSGPIDAVTNASLWTTKTSLEAALNGITPICPQNNPLLRSANARDKRAANNTLIGNTQVISCDYKRGDRVSSESRFCGLCSLCWGWRQLPADYYPTFLNEVHCATDTTCLKGYGRCNPVTKIINVLRKKFDTSGLFKYEQVAIDTVTSCECQVEDGSAMHNMVYADAAP